MGRTQFVVVVCVSALTAVALVSFLAGAPLGIVRLLDVCSSASLLVAAIAVANRLPEQVLITVALGLSAVGDLFLSRMFLVTDLMANVGGLICFLAAYVVLTAALLQGRPHPWEALLILPYLGTGTVVVWALKDELTGVFLLAVPIFLLVITVMAWSATTTLQRTYFVPRVRRWAAIGAGLLFASDAAVAFEMFYPAFSPEPPQLVQLFVRASCIAGWLLMLLIACDPVLRESPS